MRLVNEKKSGPGWIRAQDNEVRWNFGVWLRSQSESQGAYARKWEVDRSLLTRWARYERPISDTVYKRKEGATPLSKLVFKTVGCATYRDYLASFDYFNEEYLRKKEREEKVRALVTAGSA